MYDRTSDSRPNSSSHSRADLLAGLVGNELSAIASAICEHRPLRCDTHLCSGLDLSVTAPAQPPDMMTIPVEIRKSEIHGMGIFAIHDIHKGQVLWMLTPGLDRTLSDYGVKYSEPRMRDFVKTRGYLNPNKPQWVICVDEAQFWNFPKRGEEANNMMGDEIDGQKLVLAARDIKTGEKLTIPPESDGDYERKMEGRK